MGSQACISPGRDCTRENVFHKGPYGFLLHGAFGQGGGRGAGSCQKAPFQGALALPPSDSRLAAGGEQGHLPPVRGGGGGSCDAPASPLPPQPVHREGLCHRVLLPRALLAPHAVLPAERVGKLCPGGLVNPESTHLPPAQG